MNYIFLTPIIASILNFLSLVFMCQLNFKKINNRIIISFVIGFVYIFSVCLKEMGLEYGVIHTGIYIALSFISWNIYMLSATAQRIRILIEIYQKDKFKLKEVLDLYNTKEIYENRLKRLLDLNYILLNEDRSITIVNKKFLLINKVLNIFRSLIYNQKY